MPEVSQVTREQIQYEGHVAADADALDNAIKASALKAYDDAKNFVFHGEGKAAWQKVLDALRIEGRFIRYYGRMTSVMVFLKTNYPELVLTMSPVEIVPFVEDGLPGGVVTDVPFDVERARYPEQPSRADAEAFATALVAAPAEGGDAQ